MIEAIVHANVLEQVGSLRADDNSQIARAHDPHGRLLS